MGSMVFSLLLWVVQDFYHQPYGQGQGSYRQAASNAVPSKQGKTLVDHLGSSESQAPYFRILDFGFRLGSLCHANLADHTS